MYLKKKSISNAAYIQKKYAFSEVAKMHRKNRIDCKLPFKQ